MEQPEKKCNSPSCIFIGMRANPSKGVDLGALFVITQLFLAFFIRSRSVRSISCVFCFLRNMMAEKLQPRHQTLGIWLLRTKRSKSNRNSYEMRRPSFIAGHFHDGPKPWKEYPRNYIKSKLFRRNYEE